jgi:hypothetical protein
MDAVEREPLFGMHHTEPNLECPVGKGIRPSLGPVYEGAEQAVRRQLDRRRPAPDLASALISQCRHIDATHQEQQGSFNKKKG